MDINAELKKAGADLQTGANLVLRKIDQLEAAADVAGAEALLKRLEVAVDETDAEVDRIQTKHQEIVQ